ncbi:hypothetical protein CSKR_108495 [Clonorchis sinensis]|uniref:Uncharacterized protein n=1 Tax=Clonorchis sinensis TaxID=79923 RepID=A0A3R7F7M4_CLOSI|nr:hypothetical protein CSKR_108495 [Clonorchis sinensis]
MVPSDICRQTSCFRLPIHTSPISVGLTVAPFRCLTVVPPEGSVRAGILPGCPSPDRSSLRAGVGFEPRNFYLIAILKISEDILWGSQKPRNNSDKDAKILIRRSVGRTQPLHLDCSCPSLGNLAVSKPSWFFQVAWQLGTERVLQLNNRFSILREFTPKT